MIYLAQGTAVWKITRQIWAQEERYENWRCQDAEPLYWQKVRCSGIIGREETERTKDRESTQLIQGDERASGPKDALIVKKKNSDPVVVCVELDNNSDFPWNSDMSSHLLEIIQWTRRGVGISIQTGLTHFFWFFQNMVLCSGAFTYLEEGMSLKDQCVCVIYRSFFFTCMCLHMWIIVSFLKIFGCIGSSLLHASSL